MARVSVGWVSAGDVSEAEWDDGIVLTLDGVPDAENSTDEKRVAWAAATTTSLRGLVGQVVPVTSVDVPWVNGVYRVKDAGARSSPLMMASGLLAAPKLVLERLAGGVPHGEIAISGAYYPVTSPVTHPGAFIRFGLPGRQVVLDPAMGFDELRDTPDGRVHLLGSPVGAQRVASFSCEVGELLAGSPRVEIYGAGSWWPIHGQPPPGVPVRVHNGRVGLKLPIGGDGALLNVSAAGVVTETGYKVWDTSGLVAAQLAVAAEVVRGDSELLTIRWANDRKDISGNRLQMGRSTELTIRRGMTGFVLSQSMGSQFGLSAALTGSYNDGSDNDGSNVIGMRSGGWVLANGAVVPTPATLYGYSVCEMRPYCRVGTDGWRSRAWGAPSLDLLR